tara:strand:- start:760 stop:2382 length:1623 start_codon:yes stop_codon:yes gene_type:complete
MPKNKAWAALNSKNYSVSFSDYADWASVLMESDSKNIIVFILFLEDIFIQNIKEKEMEENLKTVLQLIVQRLKTADTPMLLSPLYIENINLINETKNSSIIKKVFNWLLLELENIKKNYNNFYFLDVENEFSRIGKASCLDKRNWYIAHCHLSSIGIRTIAKSIYKVLYRHYNAARKVLVLDCDNTLWGGIIGEENRKSILLGQDGIGKIYHDFQKEIKILNKKGILILLASKNNEEEVWSFFNENTNMILKKEDITTYRINWKDKSANIAEMSKELNLGLDSFVFWDDSPIEREKVKLKLPEVFTVDVPGELYQWPELLKDLYCFSSTIITKEDLLKKEQYRSRAKFIQDKQNIINEKSYLKSINLQPKLHLLTDTNINRAAQLSQKTNQFNLRTKRYSIENLNEMNKSKTFTIYLVSLKDIYGEHGLVGLICLKRLNKTYFFLDTFLMSCRAMGRYLEAWMLTKIIEKSNLLGYKFIIGELIETRKNIPVKNFFKDYGFETLKLHESKVLKINSKNRNLYKRSVSEKVVLNGDIYEKD